MLLPLDEHHRFDNTATGWRALRNNITGSENTATDAYALQGNAIGIENSTLGKHALYFNKDGNYNTAVVSKRSIGTTTTTTQPTVYRRSLAITPAFITRLLVSEHL